MIRDLWRLLRQMPDWYLQRFEAWAKDVDRRSKEGEFGKWPWQEDYGFWPWQRKRR